MNSGIGVTKSAGISMDILRLFVLPKRECTRNWCKSSKKSLNLGIIKISIYIFGEITIICLFQLPWPEKEVQAKLQ